MLPRTIFIITFLIFSQASKKCFGLGPNSELKNDAPVVLSKECQFKFEVVFKGVLKTNNYCIHPLGGGDPSDGQKLCYWQGCEDTKRLRYHINTAGDYPFFKFCINCPIYFTFFLLL